MTKQLITLSTAIITITITFSKDLVGGVSNQYLWLLLVVWGIYFFSILLGLSTLGALTGNLDPMPVRRKDRYGKEVRVPIAPIISVNTDNIVSTSRLQVYSFILAVFLTCLYGYLNANAASNSPKVSESTNKGKGRNVCVDSTIECCDTSCIRSK
ncbi:MAG: hypothetical protein Q8916_01055 [Bacteroidota bacterium]|nr:hypothetical protein [Bacteroidota bacterium]MDP4228975.1 hypothetical protein [Bacteroidota bacterium]